MELLNKLTYTSNVVLIGEVEAKQYEIENYGCRKTYLFELEDDKKRLASLKLSFNILTNKGYLHSFRNFTDSSLSYIMEYINILKKAVKDFTPDIEFEE